MQFNGLDPIPGIILDEIAPAPGEWIIDLHTLLGTTMEQPQPYGTFHLTAFAIVIFLAALISYLFRNAGPRAMRAAIFCFWMLMVSFEIAETFWASSDLINGELVWNYR